MEGTYEVISAGQAVGTVRVSRQGLYYQFDCQCDLTGEVMFRLIMESGGNCFDLGILIPENGKFVLHCKRNNKQIPIDAPRFVLNTNHKCSQIRSVSVCAQEPFGYLSDLENAFLRRENGKKMFAFREEK